MGLLDLVEQHHLVRTAAHGLGELPAGVVTDVARRRADEPRHRVRLGVLRHVETGHRRLGVKERLGDGLGRLGLADTGRAEKKERADGPASVEARGVAPQDVGDAREPGAMPDHALGQERFEREHALAVGLEQALHRHVGELGDHLGDALRSHVACRAAPGARPGEVENRKRLVGKHAARQVAHRPRDGRGERVVGVRDSVVLGEPLGNPIEDLARNVLIGLFDFDDREAPSERGIGLERALVLVGCRGADAGQLAARQCELELALDLFDAVAAEERVDLVEEEDHPSHGLAHFVANRGNALGERAAHVGSSDELGDGDLDDDAIVERRHLVAGDDTLRDPAHDRGFADARRSNQDGVVGVALGEDVERLIDFGSATDDRLQRSCRSGQREVLSERGQGRKELGVERKARVGVCGARTLAVGRSRSRSRSGSWSRSRRRGRGRAVVEVGVAVGVGLGKRETFTPAACVALGAARWAAVGRFSDS